MHEPYISHQIAEVTFLAAYIPLGYKLLDLQWYNDGKFLTVNENVAKYRL